MGVYGGLCGSGRQYHGTLGKAGEISPRCGETGTWATMSRKCVSTTLYKEGTMRFISLAVTTLCIMLTVSPVLARDKKGEKPMDPQAMMELWKKLATPGEP